MHATYSIRRLPNTDEHEHVQRRSRTVPTVKKSQATIAAACWRTNERQARRSRCGAGATPACFKTFQRASPTPRRRACAVRRQSGDSPNRCSHTPASRSTRAPAHRPAVAPENGARTSNASRQDADASSVSGRATNTHMPRPPRQNPAERAQKQPIARRERRPRQLPTQNRDFVSEHDDLQLLRRVPARTQHNQPEQTADDEIHERHQHDLQTDGPATLPSSPVPSPSRDPPRQTEFVQREDPPP